MDGAPEPRVSSQRRAGLGLFAVVALGQTVVLLGNSLANFAVGVWAYESSGSVTKFALLSFFYMGPLILFSPWAGALVDRWDRRTALIVSDTGAALCTLAMAILFWQGRVSFWVICLISAVGACFGALQFPAFSAMTTQVVPKAQLGRANGMVESGQAIATLAGPLLAGFLFDLLKVRGLILIEFLTFIPALGTLFLLRRLPPTEQSAATEGDLLKEAAAGWSYIRQRRGLTYMLVLFAVINFTFGSLQVLITPLVLSFASSKVLGTILSTAGLGMLVGGGAVTLWGGPRRRIAAILTCVAVEGLALMVGGLRAQALPVAAAAFTYILCQPVLATCSQTIWQSKVPIPLQGRVFAMRRMVSMSTLPLALLLAGPLADRVFEPLMAAGGPLAGSVGRIIGTGQGRGIALLLITLGFLMLATCAAALRTPALRDLEDMLPDALPNEPNENDAAGLGAHAASAAGS
jgi:DHA3 family macrolide efflux protein-like MFS transporter